MELCYQDAMDDLAHFESCGADAQALGRIEGLINHCFFLMNKYTELETRAEGLQAQVLSYQESLFGKAERAKEKGLRTAEPSAEKQATDTITQASHLQDTTSTQPDQASSNTAVEPKASDVQPNANRGGRLSFDDYPNAPIQVCEHSEYQLGDPCPECLKGRLYAIDPNRKVVVDGQSPFLVSRYLLKVLRCALCGATFKAQAPVDVREKYRASAKAVLAYLHYGAGVTYYGIERMQMMQNAPIPLSTQSEIIESAASAVYALTNHLAHIGRESDLIIQDDTSVRILELIKQNKTQDPERKGMYTTGFVFKGEHPFVLYMSGRQHAGENFDELMAGRQSATVPTRVADALSANSDHEAIADQGKCNAHAFRKFRTLMSLFPNEASRVLHIYDQIYNHDEHCRNERYPPEQRLAYHQIHSQPLMDELFAWARNLLLEKKAEPNGVLGKLLQYLINHESGLTLFLRKPNVPIDSNEVERMLKEVIRYRKRSLFFGTSYSADYGSRYISLIATCHMHQIDSIDYLTQIQLHEQSVWKDPGSWLPWNYQQNTLDQAA